MDQFLTDRNVHRLVGAISQAVQTIRQTLNNGKSAYSENGQEFVDRGYGVLCGAIGAYEKLFVDSHCPDRQKLEDVWARSFSNKDVREIVEELLKLEEEWDEFLLEIDCNLHNLSAEQKWNKDSIILTNIEDGDNFTLNRVAKNSRSSLFVLLRHFA